MKYEKMTLYYCEKCGNKFLGNTPLVECPACKSKTICGVPKDTVKVILEH